MSVIHINTNKNWGGGENQVLHLLLGLRKRGVHSILCSHRDGGLFKIAAKNNLTVLPVSNVFTGPLRWLGAQSLARHLGTSKHSLIHAHDSLGLDWGLVISRVLRVPLVLSRRVASPLRLNPWSRRKYSSSRIAMVLAISRTVRDVMLKSGFEADRIRIVPDGIDFEQLEAVDPDTSFRSVAPTAKWVGGLGSLTRKKNWFFLIRTAAQIMKNKMDVHWIIVGDGPERKALQKLAAELGLSGRIHFTGFRPDGIRVLKALDALFFPSSMEGASVTVREAMGLGIPVVASDSAGVVESLNGHGWIVRCDDVEAAAASIEEALNNRDKRVMMTQAARKSALERFPISATVDGTLQVYRDVLSMRTLEG